MSGTPPTAEPAARDPLIGRTIERYRIERILGSGGMGAVYQARHEELGSLAAVKTILPHALSDETTRARFVREAHLLSRVQAPGLVQIYNVNQLSDGTPYILMEHLPGQTLSQRLEQTPEHRLSENTALAITEQVAATLAALHAQGVVHRDLKPSNIMLVPDPIAPEGELVTIFDFGIAKLLEENATATLTRSPLGTPLYMAPESCEGSVVTGAADVYSLGCVLYEMLCGRTPYLDDRDSNVMLKHLFTTPALPSQHNPGLSPAVDEFVLALLARQPVDRPPDQQLVAQARALRLTPKQVRWRLRRLVRQLRPKRFRISGTRLAIGLGMPLIILTIFMFFMADYLAHWLPWPAVQRALSWSAMVRVPGGRFVMGSSPEERQIARSLAKHYDLTVPSAHGNYSAEYENPNKDYLSREATQRTVELTPFDIDRYEVSNQAFAEFLNRELAAHRIVVEEHCPNKSGPGIADGISCVWLRSGHRPYKNLYNDPRYGGIVLTGDHFTVQPEYRRRPVVAVSWQAATDYCAAHGKRLPTEAQWEYAVRRSGRRFPWGDEAPGCSHAVLERCGDRGKFCACMPAPDTPALLAVGSQARDRTVDGVYDMAGSVSEWTADWFVSVLPGSDSMLRNPVELVPTGEPAEPRYRTLRGGSWTQDFLSARGAARFNLAESALYKDVGFRCVRNFE